MPDKARSRRRQEEQAERERRQAQSQRDKARHQQERAASIRHALRRELTLKNKSNASTTQLPSIAVVEERPSTISQVSLMEIRSNKFMKDIAKMFGDTRYSDATIHIHEVTLPVHKSIICIQSAYFEKAFQKTFDEGCSGVLTFKDGSGAAHWRVFEYLYTGDYSDDLSNNIEDDPVLLKDPRVYALADMFFLENLKALCIIKLQQKLQDLWASDSFPECVREIYASTDDKDQLMRSAVVEVAKIHIRELSKKAIFVDLIREGGDFAVDCFEGVVSIVPLPPFTFR